MKTALGVPRAPGDSSWREELGRGPSSGLPGPGPASPRAPGPDSCLSGAVRPEGRG